MLLSFLVTDRSWVKFGLQVHLNWAVDNIELFNVYCGCAELGVSSLRQDISIVAPGGDAVGGERLENA